MKEVFLGKLPFHLIFFKNGNWMLLPFISLVPRTLNSGTEIIIGWLKWRTSFYCHNKNNVIVL